MGRRWKEERGRRGRKTGGKERKGKATTKYEMTRDILGWAKEGVLEYWSGIFLFAAISGILRYTRTDGETLSD